MPNLENISYSERVGLRASNITELLEQIQRGANYNALYTLMDAMHLGTKEIADLVEISERTLARRRIEGRLKQDETEKLLRTSRIFGKAVDLFNGDEEAAARWLQTPVRALGNKQPIEFMSSEIGSREVEDLIGRLEHGVFS